MHCSKVLFSTLASFTLSLIICNHSPYDLVHQRRLWFGIVQIVDPTPQKVPKACLLEDIFSIILAQKEY
jgi:hypothetical protein